MAIECRSRGLPTLETLTELSLGAPLVSADAFNLFAPLAERDPTETTLERVAADDDDEDDDEDEREVLKRLRGTTEPGTDGTGNVVGVLPTSWRGRFFEATLFLRAPPEPSDFGDLFSTACSWGLGGVELERDRIFLTGTSAEEASGVEVARGPDFAAVF